MRGPSAITTGRRIIVNAPVLSMPRVLFLGKVPFDQFIEQHFLGMLAKFGRAGNRCRGQVKADRTGRNVDYCTAHGLDRLHVAVGHDLRIIVDLAR